MKDKLQKLLNNSYSTNSKDRVAAILIDKDGKEWKGVNIENAAFPSSMCAERSAFYNAISNGVKPNGFKELHIASNQPRPLYPCGACVQVISELFGTEGKIFIYGPDKVIEHTLSDIAPFAINKESFEWK